MLPMLKLDTNYGFYELFLEHSSTALVMCIYWSVCNGYFYKLITKLSISLAENCKRNVPFFNVIIYVILSPVWKL